MIKVLVIEDDPAIVRLLTLAIKTNGYEYAVADKGLNGISLFLSEKPSVVLLDLGLPDIDGMEVIKQIRQASSTPILVISARGSEAEKVEALDCGADDYITKPFNVSELLARIRVALRRGENINTSKKIFNYKNLEINYDKHQVFVNDVLVHLTPIEFNLLELLTENQGRVLTHKYIQQMIWGYENEDEYQSLRVYMTTLRRKIEKDSSKPQYILTEIGVGYRFNDD